MDENQEIIFLSGIIDKDNNNIGVELDESYTLICKSYEISRDNKIEQFYPLSRISGFSLKGSNSLTIKVKGKVALNNDNNIIDTLNTVCENATPFMLNIGEQSFQGMILKSFSANIDSYGVTADCSLVFMQVGDVI